MGHNSPPVKTQIRKGERRKSGGRPKGSRNAKTIVQKIARERIAFKEKGKSRRLPAVQVLLLVLRQMAMNGDVRAARRLDKLRTRYQPAEVKGGYVVVPEQVTVEEFEERYRYLGYQPPSPSRE